VKNIGRIKTLLPESLADDNNILLLYTMCGALALITGKGFRQHNIDASLVGLAEYDLLPAVPDNRENDR